MQSSVGKSTRVILHLIGAGLFIASPGLMYMLQGTDLHDVRRSLDTGADMNAFFVRQSWLRFCIQNLILTGLFYINYLVLIPKYLIARRWINYVLSLVATSMLVTAAVWYWHLVVDHWIGSNPMPFVHRYIETALSQFVLLSGGIALGISEHNRKLILQQQEKEKLLLESEVQLLHSRINPHFIFNSLNNIYSLSVTNSSSTSDALLRLSSLLRFLVYDSGKETIPVEKELQYISDYIALESLRSPENIEVNFKTSGSASGQIHPMLLIPFIENAFKHGRTMMSTSRIVISVEVNEKSIHLCTENSIHARAEELTEKGIGQSNTRRRLELLYPGKHSLNISNDGKTYKVDLNIKLHENPMHSN